MADKLRLDPDILTPRDFRRARERLGVDPYDTLASDITEDRLAFIVWCLKSRTDPDFTMEQALDTPFSEFDMGGDGPPPTPGSAANGASPGSNGAPASKTTPNEPEPAPSSASSSA